MATPTKIKVQFVYPEESRFRGIGYYATNLLEALKTSGQIELVEEKPDLIHYPFFDLFAPTLPLFRPRPTVVTIHDLTPLVLSQLYPQGIRAKLALARQKVALSSVAAVVTDSTNSEMDIVSRLKLPPQRVFVTPLGVSRTFFAKLPIRKLNSLAKRLQLPEKFVMTVAGGPNPNKNLVRLAQVTQALDIPLVIVGKGMLQELPPGEVHPELRDLQRLREFDHLVLPGYVPDEDLVGLYQLATVYCQASLYEGFGLPLLEAMAAGCLIVSSNTSSLPEIYPAKTITFDPYSEESMEKALKKALNLNSAAKAGYIRKGRYRANEFSWEKTADATIAAYSWVYENHHRRN